MDNQHLDNIFRERLGDYESKTQIDTDALWANVNTSITPTRSMSSFLKNPWFYGGISIAVGIVALSYVYVFHKTVIPDKTEHQTIVKEFIVPKNKSINNVPNEPLTESTNKIEEKAITKPVQVFSKATLKPVNSVQIKAESEPVTEQVSKSEESVATKNTAVIESSTDKPILAASSDTISKTEKPLTKKVTVVKKQIVHTDSVVNVKRVRK